MESIQQAIKYAVATNRMRVQAPTDIEAADHIWSAVLEAIKNPREIDEELVNAYLAGVQVSGPCPSISGGILRFRFRNDLFL